MLQNQYFIRLTVTSVCLFTLKDTMIIPVTWNNCHVSLALMKVQFLLKDAWSSDCCIDNSLQVSLSLSLFFFSGLVRRERGQLRKTWLWMPTLPPHCFPLVWSNRSGLWKRWIIILLGDKAKDADRPRTDGQLVRAGQRAGLGRLPFHGVTEQRAGLDFTSGGEPSNKKSLNKKFKLPSNDYRMPEAYTEQGNKKEL